MADPVAHNIPLWAAFTLTYSFGFIALFYGIFNYLRVKQVNLEAGTSNAIDTPLAQDTEDLEMDRKKIDLMLSIGEYISRGANAFLKEEYFYIGIFLVVFSVVVYLAVDSVNSNWAPWTVLAFIFGGLTSILSGFIGMRVAVISNYRTTYEARNQLAPAFKVAFRAGCVIGFVLSALALLVLITLVLVYRSIGTDRNTPENLNIMFDQIAGYGLGGSSIALFGRVGGGIYTKAADVGADLVGKLEQDLPEDSPKNPATIADNVGDNVGDIAGMGADLFGSFAEASSAALVVLSEENFAIFAQRYGDKDSVYMFAPIMISAVGLICCIICSLFATDIMSVDEPSKIEFTLKCQLYISTAILLAGIYFAFWMTLNFDESPADDALYVFVLEGKQNYKVTPLRAFICAASGLIAGLIIGVLTEYYTSNTYKPVKEVARSCETGAATNIIYGLALGYLSTIIPILALAIASYLSHRLLGLFGISLAALGMLSNLGVALAIDSYGPISDNAGGIAEMSELGEHVRERTDALDAAGNTTAAIGKGFAIGSAALVSLALYSAFISRATVPKNDGNDRPLVYLQDKDVAVTDPLVFAGLLIGAMLPYAFSAFTMKSVGEAAKDMVKEVRNQLQENPKIKTGEANPNYERCVQISTKSAIREMVLPGALVILTPLITGFIFGPKAIAGLLPGALVSGVQMAISASNTGGAWDNAKKYIESGKLEIDNIVKKKGSDEHKAAVIGDTVGDPLKDTSGPSLNILVKLSAILSLVFVQAFRYTSRPIVCWLGDESDPNVCDGKPHPMNGTMTL